MNVEMDEKGCLIVTSESALESYALDQWVKGNAAFGCEGPACNSTMLVETNIEDKISDPMTEKVK